MTTENTDRNQLAALSRAGRPRKGTQRRTVGIAIEPRIAEIIDADRQDGESRADVVTRWAEERA